MSEIIFYKSYADAEANCRDDEYVEVMGNANRKWYCKKKSERPYEAYPQGATSSIPNKTGGFPGI